MSCTAATSLGPPTTSRSTWTSASDGSWSKGTGKTFDGGVGEGAKGNEGTSAAIKSTPMVHHLRRVVFATAQGLTSQSIVTSAGPDPVEISLETVGKTIEGAKVKGTGNDLVLDTSSFYKPTPTGAYPIVLATYSSSLEVRRRRHRYGRQVLPNPRRSVPARRAWPTTATSDAGRVQARSWPGGARSSSHCRPRMASVPGHPLTRWLGTAAVLRGEERGCGVKPTCCIRRLPPVPGAKEAAVAEVDPAATPSSG